MGTLQQINNLTEIKTPQERFIQRLKDNYQKLKWSREDQELTTSMGGGYLITLNYAQGEGTFLQVRLFGSVQGHSLSDKDYPEVDILYNSIWEYINKSEEENFWNEVMDKFDDNY